MASFGQPEHRWLGPLAKLLRMLALSMFVSQRMVMFVSKTSHADLCILKDLIEAREITPVVDKAYPLEQVPEALTYLEKGHARGKVVITV